MTGIFYIPGFLCNYGHHHTGSWYQRHWKGKAKAYCYEIRHRERPCRRKCFLQSRRLKCSRIRFFTFIIRRFPTLPVPLLKDSITDYLEDKYFKKDWNNYTIQITICSQKKLLHIQPQDYLINCDLYFQNILKEFGKPTLSKHLYYLDYGYGYRNYLAIIPLIPEKNPHWILFCLCGDQLNAGF